MNRQQPSRVATTAQQQNAGRKVVPPSAPAKSGKLMRLRCRLRPLHDVCFNSDRIADQDCDVTFYCDGGELQAHKIILAMASKFFTHLFRDQKPHQPSFVSLPDVPVAVMRLILLLCYKDRVCVGMKVLKDLGNYLAIFGLSLDQFNFSESTATDQASSSRKSLPAANSINNGNSNNNNHNRAATLPRQPAQFQVGKGQGVVKSAHGQATSMKNPQNFAQEAKESNDGDYQQGYDNVLPKQATRPRLILPKPPGTSGQVVYRTIQTGPPVLQRMATIPSQQTHHAQSSQSQSHHSIEMDVSADSEDAEPVDSPEAKKLMQEWMASLGKSAGSPPKLSRNGPAPGPSPAKRRASPVGSGGRILKGGAEKSARMQCSVCSNIFDDESKWRWHEERHVGLSLFKCTICDQILPTARKVYQHEMMEHGIVASGSDETEGMNSVPKGQAILIGHLPVGVEGKPRVTIVRTQQGSHYRRVPTPNSPSKTGLIKKYKTAATAKLHQNFAHRNPNILIGHTEGQELVETRKLKQLHWLYVCTKCETCSDTSAKALTHHRECFSANPEKQFEDSVHKFRQGFYGKCKCPLCPRRYTSLNGFLIHCGHMHQGYRKKFSHISTEDRMMCVTCREKFTMPNLFHAHLNGDYVCEKQVKEESDHGMDEHGHQQSSSTNKTFEESRQKQYAKLLGTNPRSARLQSRLAAVTSCYEDDVVDEETLPLVACPICGQGEIKNLTIHLSDAHPEIDVKIERIEVSTLRCKACSITFATCDLLAHNNSCTGSKGLNYVAQRKAAALTMAAKPSQEIKPKEPLEYPEGIGCSSVDTMDYDYEDLTSIEVLWKQFQCPICKRTGKKMNVVSDCLKNHGVFRCAVCFNTFLSKDHNSQHLKKCHGTNNGAKLVCPICKIIRANAGQLVSHMYTAHWQPLLVKGADITGTKASQEGEDGEGEKNETDTLNSSSDVSGVGNDSKGDDSIPTLDDYSDLTLTELLKTSDPAGQSKVGDVDLAQEEPPAIEEEDATKPIENDEEVKSVEDKIEPPPEIEIAAKTTAEDDK